MTAKDFEKKDFLNSALVRSYKTKTTRSALLHFRLNTLEHLEMFFEGG